MSWAAVVEESLVRQFRASARAFVELIMRGLPSASVSPRIHVVFHHASELVKPCGDIGLSEEQAVES